MLTFWDTFNLNTLVLGFMLLSKVQSDMLRPANFTKRNHLMELEYVKHS